MKISDFKIGQTAEIKHKITEKDIEKFVDLTGDDNRLHVDIDYAKKTSFKKPVVHGMLGASFISTVIGTKLPGDGALWFSQNIEFLLPARSGDTITIEAEIIKIHEKQDIIELRTDIFNQNKQKLITGTAKVKLVEQKREKTTPTTFNIPKTALIIGASGGIGSEISMFLAEEGYDLFLHYYSGEENVRKLKNKIEEKGSTAHLIQGDLTKEKDIEKLVSAVNRKFSNIYALIFCASGSVSDIRFDALEWEDIQKHIDLNIKTLLFLTQAFKEKFKQQKYGRIIALTTQYTESVPPKNMMHYVTAKSALNGFMKSLAVEFAPFGITVNSVSPSMTETDLIANVPQKNKLLYAAQTPVKRLAETKDVANAVSFLISENSGFITGQTIRVNGGLNML